MLKSALPFTSEILLVAAIFPEISVTVTFATPSPSIEIVRSSLVGLGYALPLTVLISLIPIPSELITFMPTAFGISGLAAATAFKKTGGKLVTMDAYIEEKCGDAGTYKDFERTVYEKSDGYKSVKFLIEQFDLESTMIPEIGWSPDDVESIITKNYDEKLDFVFLDAGHFSEQIIKDIDSIRPFLAEKFIFIFHDVYPWSFDETAQQHVENVFGKRVEIVLPFPQGENMGILRNM